jgi:hypothetical protein
MKGSPTQGTPPYYRHLQCQAGRSVSPSEVECNAARATQARQVPTKESEEVCPTPTRQEGLVQSPMVTLGLVAGGLITHIRETTTEIQKPKKDSQTDPRQKKSNMTYLATWNVQSLFRVSAVKGQVNEIRKYRIMIGAIKDVRRLELRWLDYTENDLKSRGIETWRREQKTDMHGLSL